MMNVSWISGLPRSGEDCTVEDLVLGPTHPLRHAPADGGGHHEAVADEAAHLEQASHAWGLAQDRRVVGVTS